MTRNDGGTVALSGWFNLADYILDPEQIIYPQVFYHLDGLTKELYSVVDCKKKFSLYKIEPNEPFCIDFKRTNV